MINIDLKISVSLLSKYSRIFKGSIPDDMIESVVYSFTKYLRHLYLESIRNSIYSKRYKGKWEPTDDKEYLAYLGTIPSTNILDLIDSALEIEELPGSYYTIRFNRRYKYPGTRLPLTTVLRAIEDGTSKFHARPILAKSAREIEHNIFKLWKGFLAKRGVI